MMKKKQKQKKKHGYPSKQRVESRQSGSADHLMILAKNKSLLFLSKGFCRPPASEKGKERADSSS